MALTQTDMSTAAVTSINSHSVPPLHCSRPMKKYSRGMFIKRMAKANKIRLR